MPRKHTPAKKHTHPQAPTTTAAPYAAATKSSRTFLTSFPPQTFADVGDWADFSTASAVE